MRSGRSVLGVTAGVLLALGVVILAGSGLNPYGMHAASPAPILSAANASSAQSVTAASTGGAPAKAPMSNATFATMAGQTSSSSGVGAAPLSQVNSIARQPVALTGLALLPIFAALLFGFVLYRASRVRSEEDEPPQAA